MKKIFRKNNKKNKGFILLFTVVLSSIILAITLSVTNVLYQENKFSAGAKDANDAFFAADAGSECALFYDKKDSIKNAFTGTATMNCAGNAAIIVLNPSPSVWNFVVSQLGNTGQGCVKVTVDKFSIPGITTIISKGYNNGGNIVGSCLQDPTSVERELDVTY